MLRLRFAGAIAALLFAGCGGGGGSSGYTQSDAIAVVP